MRFAAALASVGLAAAACLAAPPDPPETVSVQASCVGGMRPLSAEIRIDRDGSSSVVATDRPGREEPVSLSLRLTGAEMDDLRRLVRESRFLDEEEALRPPAPDAGTWAVTIVLGAREKRREGMWEDASSAPLRHFLWRFVDLARAVGGVRRGDALPVARDVSEPGASAKFLRPELVVSELTPALVRLVRSAQRRSDAYPAANYLLVLLPAPEWTARFRELLPALAGEPREGALSAWQVGVAEPGREVQRAAFVPFAVAEVRSSWRDWEKLPHGRQDLLRALLGMAVRERDAGAIALAEEMTRSLSTQDRPFLGSSLADIGTDAVPVALRLFGDAAPEARMGGAGLAEYLAGVARDRRGWTSSLSVDGRALLAARWAEELRPVVEAHARDGDEAFFVREECVRALDVWEGRDRYAERRKAQDADAKRRADEQAARQKEADAAARKFREEQGPPVQRGTLAISGRLVTDGDAGLPGFTVIAERDDGPPANPWRFHGTSPTAADGSFRIEGLVDGKFRLVAVRGAKWGWREFASNTSEKDDVAAGSEGVRLSFAGALVRGRLVDSAGRPVARRSVAVRMRDPPGVLTQPGLDVTGWAETDADGRFVVVQLLRGVYDVEVPGIPRLGGAAGLSPGAEERMIWIDEGGAIAGRVVDETGAPLAGADVFARPEGEIGAGRSAKTGPDGAFRIDSLDLARAYVIDAVYSTATMDLRPDRRAEGVRVGSAPVEFRIDTGPRLCVRVDFGRRRVDGGACLRLVRDGDADAKPAEFRETAIDWRAAPEGTWHVFARVRDLDADGSPAERWIEVGTAATGAPERTLQVPR
jgi:hypothetical protein